MQLREALQRILVEYPTARSQPLSGHPLANYIRSVPDGIKEIIPTITFGRRDLLVNGTVFPGNWAYVPWLAVLDPRITNTTQKGVYVVYLCCCVSLKGLLTLCAQSWLKTDVNC